jgi:hypothetical protein
MPEAEQPTEEEARQFVLSTVWQALSDLADQINAKSNRIATLAVDAAAPQGRVSLSVYPVGSQPAQAPPLFRYDVAVARTGSRVSIRSEAQPAVVNGQMRSREQGELAMTTPGEHHPVTPEHIRDDVARRYRAVMVTQTARDAGRCT